MIYCFTTLLNSELLTTGVSISWQKLLHKAVTDWSLKNIGQGKGTKSAFNSVHAVMQKMSLSAESQAILKYNCNN